MITSNIASVLVILLLLSLTACKRSAHEQYPYLIKLSVAGCPGYKSGVVTLARRGAGLTVIDTAQVEKGQLVFRGVVEHPGVYSLSCPCLARKTTTIINVYLPADSVQATVDLNQNLLPTIYQKPGLGAYPIGSYLRDTRLFSTAPQQREVALYLQMRDSLWNKFFLDKAEMAFQLNAAIGVGNQSEIDRWGDSTRRVQAKFPEYLAVAAAQFVKQRPAEVALFAMLDAGDSRVAQQRLRPYYQALPDSIRASYFGQVLSKRYGVPAAAATP